MNKILQGDCLIKLKELEDNSVDSIVTDPPAGISFMGKTWDSDKGGRDNWIAWMCEVATECKRILKPGGHAFVWAIPRTSHWTATAWENAGFEIRDVVAHVFGSGFPKSLNIGKQVDKLQGNDREVIGVSPNDRPNSQVKGGRAFDGAFNEGQEHETIKLTKGNSKFEGWGTALKPAREDWILMRKPLEKGLTVAENCLKYGTGGINIDESRVGTDKIMINGGGGGEGTGWGKKEEINEERIGRFPANLIHDNSEEVRECFPEVKGATSRTDGSGVGMFANGNKDAGVVYEDNQTNASRFFKSILYVPKASKSERNKGCEDMEDKERIDYGGFHSEKGLIENNRNPENRLPNKNNHPTVKPIALMEYLIKMVTKPGGVVLDPFAGSGSTLVAAKQNGFQYIGIEMTEEYIPIIEARLEAVEQLNTLF